MRFLILLSVLSVGFGACKNTEPLVGKAKKEQPTSNVKDIIIDANRQPVKPDFRVLEMTNANDVLTIVVQYGGGCAEHDFNAYFSGGWAKSMPPQAAISLEHLNPDNDRCRSIVRDTFQFNLQPLQYAGGKEVVVKWNVDPKQQTIYSYVK